MSIIDTYSSTAANIPDLMNSNFPMSLPIEDNHAFNLAKIRIMGTGVRLATKFPKDHFKQGPWSNANVSVRAARCDAHRSAVVSADHVVVNEQDIAGGKRKNRSLPTPPKFLRMSSTEAL